VETSENSILDADVSLFKGSFDPTVMETIALGAALERIRNGQYHGYVTQLRQLLATQGEDAYRAAKERSIAFTPCCSLTTRDKDTPWDQKLLACTGVVQLDCDGLDDPQALKAHLAQHQATVYAFLSPRGNGLKIGLAATGITSPDTYKHAWAHVVTTIQHAYPDVHINVDEHVKFLHALCYMSADPTLYCNAHPVALVVPPRATPPPQAPRAEDETSDYARVMQALWCIPNNDAAYDDWLTLGMALHSTGESWARDAWETWSRQSSKYHEQKQAKSWRSFTADGKTTIATLFHRAKAHGWHPPRRDIPDMTTDRAASAQADAHQRQNGHTVKARALVRNLANEPERAIDWLWELYLAYGKLHLLDGDPGTGKTLLMCALAAAISRRSTLPDQEGHCTLLTGEPQRSLFVAMEDDLADTIRPRVRKAGGDVALIDVLNEIEDTRRRVQVFTLEHLPLLEEAITAHQPRLVYIDSLQGIMGPNVDIHRANQVLPLLHALADLATKYHIALVATRHPSKPGQNMSRLIHRGMGSQAFIGTARLGLYVDEHPTEPTKSLLVQSKSNAGHPAMTQIFSKAHGEFQWCGATRLTANVLAGSGVGPDPTALAEACLWLEAHLAPGDATDAAPLQKQADEDDIAWRTINRAKRALGVQARKIGDKWVWTLPVLPPYVYTTRQSTQSCQSRQSRQSWHSSIKTTSYDDTSGDQGEACPGGRESQERQECQDCHTVTEGQEPCLHEHVNDLNHCNDCGALVPALGTAAPCRHAWVIEGGQARCTHCHAQHPTKQEGVSL
jgi:hypothetical protein